MRYAASILIWWLLVYLGGAFITADWVWLSDVMDWEPSDRGFLLFELVTSSFVAWLAGWNWQKSADL